MGSGEGMCNPHCLPQKSSAGRVESVNKARRRSPSYRHRPCHDPSHRNTPSPSRSRRSSSSSPTRSRPVRPHRPPPSSSARADASRSPEISRLQNSIAHLQRSNVELLEFCDPPPGADEVEALDDATRAELELSVRENDETMCVASVLGCAGRGDELIGLGAERGRRSGSS